MFRPGLCLLIAALLSPCARAGDDVLLMLRDVPDDGLALVRVDFTEAARWCKLGAVHVDALRATLTDSDQSVPAQFVPGEEFDRQERLIGTLVARLPRGGDARLRIEFATRPSTPPDTWDGSVQTPFITVKHDATLGGLPASLVWKESGKTLDRVRWNDRLHHPEQGSFLLTGDGQARIERLSAGPLCTVVRMEAAYVQAGGKRPESQPRAVYRWHYFHDRPLVYVTAELRQDRPQTWREAHFLEFLLPPGAFPRWAGGEPGREGTFTGAEQSHRLSRFGLVCDGPSALGVAQGGTVLVYDGPRDYKYLHAQGDVAWAEWNTTHRETSAWLWAGVANDPVAAVRQSGLGLPSQAQATVTVADVRQAIDAAGQQPSWWQRAAAEGLEGRGRFADALAALEGRLPESLRTLSAGELGLVLERTADGIRLVNLLDTAQGRRLLAPEPTPLFSLTLRHAQSHEERTLTAESGWGEVAWEQEGPAVPLAIHWRKPTLAGLGDLKVSVHAEPDAEGGIAWRLNASGQAAPWSVWRVRFPELALNTMGPETVLLFPRGPGELVSPAEAPGFRYTQTYPNGWTSLQLLALYNPAARTGLYFAAHDPWGSTKDIRAEVRGDGAVVLAYDHPAPDMGRAENRFELAGQAAWHILRGDWFDAARIYRDWASREARWWPKLSAEGRDDTPRWMRELCVWGLASGPPASVVPPMRAFREYLDLPAAVHWYNWHQIPFDNDYPHYFPTQAGFAEGVADLARADVAVMPYINGRLWDTRDRGLDDFEFTKLARPAASKQEDGQPYIETYGSKESDGRKVELAVMCPATPFWQQRQRDIVLRLMNECGVRGVYMDQIAAAKPELCFDASHGHPLGGGHWWTESYWRMLREIRQAMPDQRMLTTECNAEPYLHCFDGYLTWHWQHDNQVPVFPAIYGGAIQMFGRSYGGGPTRDLALRMKAAQQLVYGEQIGWLGPAVVREPDNAVFFRQIVHMRHELRRYFYAGEMARPPRLTGEIPTMSADWQWHGQWPVSEPALVAGAWRLPAEQQLAIVLVNVADQPVEARLEYDAGEWGFSGPLKATLHSTNGPGEPFDLAPQFQLTVDMPPHAVWAWVVQPRGRAAPPVQ